MLHLMRQRNFALLWTGGLISLMGDRVLMIALPFFVYEETGSTFASAVIVAAELLPRLLFGSVAGVFVDRWDRKTVMALTSLGQGLIILPLLLVDPSSTMWIVYLVSFLQTTLAMFFGPAENALLPLLVGEEDLLTANSLNALNNNLARLIGPPLGGVILAIWGLPGVVLFDSLTFVIAALMIWLIRRQAARILPAAAVPDTKPESQPGLRFWREWLEGISFVRLNRVVAILFITVVLLNFGGLLIDPMAAPYIVDVVQAGPAVFGWLVTVQAMGGLLGGLLAGRVGQQMNTASLYGWSEVVLGVIIFIRYNIPFLPVLFVMTFLIGLPAAMGSAAMDTLFQKKVPNSHLGRIIGALNTSVGLTSLFGVLGISGLLGENLGIIPVLNLAAAITFFTGILILVLLPKD